MRTTEVRIETDVSLAGTLTLPESGDPSELVVCVHGTGPMDRDQNMPGQRLDILNTIAEHLAWAGVASYRYDKRGCGSSTGEYYSAGHEDLLNDLLAVIDHFAGDAARLRVFVLGHSEGTLLAAEASLQRDVAGLVLLSPFIQNIEVTLMKQAREIERAIQDMPGIRGRIYRVLSRVSGGPVKAQEKTIRRVKDPDTATLGRGHGRIAAKSLRELMAVNVAAIYQQVHVPALVLGGTKDLQCDPDDVRRIAEVLGPLATPVVIPDLTHILRRDSRVHTLFSYEGLIREPMDQMVLDHITRWLHAQ